MPAPWPSQRRVLELEPRDPPVVVAVAAAREEAAAVARALRPQVDEVVVLLANLVDRVADSDDRRQEGDCHERGCKKSFTAPEPRPRRRAARRHAREDGLDDSPAHADRRARRAGSGAPRASPARDPPTLAPGDVLEDVEQRRRDGDQPQPDRREGEDPARPARARAAGPPEPTPPSPAARRGSG